MSMSTITAPRVRWASIVWGLVFAGVATAALWFLAGDDRRAALADGVSTLTPVTLLTIVLLTAGALLLVGGVAGLLRHAQRRGATRRSEGLPDADAVTPPLGAERAAE